MHVIMRMHCIMGHNVLRLMYLLISCTRSIVLISILDTTTSPVKDVGTKEGFFNNPK